MAYLKLKVDDPEARKGTKTYAQLWQEHAHDYTQSGVLSLDTELKNKFGLKDDLWLAPGDVAGRITDYLAPDKSGEKAACLRGASAADKAAWGTQDFVTYTLQSIIASATNSNTIPLYVKGKDLTYNSTRPIHLPLQNWPDPWGFEKMTIGRRSPTAPFYADRELRSSAYMTFILEVKATLGQFVCGSESICSTAFPDEEKGAILDFIFELMERHQPLREYTYGVLTDSRRFQFFKVVREAQGDFAVSMSSVYCGTYDTAGWKVSYVRCAVAQRRGTESVSSTFSRSSVALLRRLCSE